MRISDWSSDVCSSDLDADRQRRASAAAAAAPPRRPVAHPMPRVAPRGAGRAAVGHGRAAETRRYRKSVVKGKSMSERVEHGRSRNINKNKTRQPKLQNSQLTERT